MNRALASNNEQSMSYYVSIIINPLNTKLSCWNFNLVNADQFSRE